MIHGDMKKDQPLPFQPVDRPGPNFRAPGDPRRNRDREEQETSEERRGAHACQVMSPKTRQLRAGFRGAGHVTVPPVNHLNSRCIVRTDLVSDIGGP